MIPLNIQNQFEEAHIEKVWDELKTRFGFNVPEWKKKFEAGFIKQSREVSRVEYFLRFGNGSINPVLNDILCRRSLHPTFNKLVDYLLEKENKGNKKSNKRNYYPSAIK
ncbi:MAG TPA: hypothetical protein PKN99_07120 [Cyclobacteriaceae bacterium]|nr:hypothetical protein [Cyclobacteriaceae bacterium]